MDEMAYIILRVLTTTIAAYIAYYVIPLLKRTIERLNDERLTDFIKEAVYAAQQTIADNEDKKNYVLERAAEWATSKGLEITQKQLDLLIESAVLTMKNALKE